MKTPLTDADIHWKCTCGHDPCDGLDCGVYLPGQAPRRRAAPKSSDEVSAIRARAWETRRAKSRCGRNKASGVYSSGFLHRLIENAFSWAHGSTNYLSPIDMDRLIDATADGMKPEQAALWRCDAPDIASAKARKAHEEAGGG